MKKCPFCAEEIQDAAIKCRYCGSMLNEAAHPPIEQFVENLTAERSKEPDASPKITAVTSEETKEFSKGLQEADEADQQRDPQPMKKCPFCATEIGAEEFRCGHCGRKVKTAPGEWKGALIFGAVMIGVITLIGFNLDAFLDMVSGVGFWSWVGLIFVVIVVLGVIVAVAENKKVAAMSPSDRQTYLTQQTANREAAALALRHGQVNPALLCPHCHQKGKVRTQPVKRKKGISGGKATAAVMTAGISLIATGLSRQEILTEAYCENCGSKWDF